MLKSSRDAIAGAGLASAIAGVAVTFGTIVIATFVTGGVTAKMSEWRAEVMAEVKDAYGIELTQEEFKELGFPRSEPEEDFVAYGTIPNTVKVGDAIERRDITLIWSEGELFLGTTEGATVTPLDSEAR